MRNLKESLKALLFRGKAFSLFLATGAFVGYLTPFPGTLGALQGILIYWLTMKFPFFYKLIILLLITFIGIYTSKIVAEHTQKEDPDEVIIDEIGGAYLASLGKESLLEIFLVFIIFRIIDITKPYPLKEIERAPSGFGIMLDDCVAGFITNLIVSLIVFGWGALK